MVNFFCYAYGMSGTDNSTAEGPEIIKKSTDAAKLDFEHRWHNICQPELTNHHDKIKDLSTYSQKFIQQMIDNSGKFCVFGGDHTSAIATIQAAQKLHGRIKILYVDAHMDLHNLETSHSQNIHGMSLAVLLGKADGKLKELKQISENINPSDICLFGVRSYEIEEKQLLEKLGINILYMDDIKAQGIEKSWQQAISSLNLTEGDNLVLSIDLDAFDPKEAPAVTVPEPNGLMPSDFLNCLQKTKTHWQPFVIGCEIVEFSPTNDQLKKTEKLIIEILNCLYT